MDVTLVQDGKRDLMKESFLLSFSFFKIRIVLGSYIPRSQEVKESSQHRRLAIQNIYLLCFFTFPSHTLIQTPELKRDMPKVHQTAATFRSPRRRTRPREYWMPLSTISSEGEEILSNTYPGANMQSHAGGPPLENHAQPVKRRRGPPPDPSKRGGPVDVGFNGIQSAKKRKTRRKGDALKMSEKRRGEKMEILLGDISAGNAESKVHRQRNSDALAHNLRLGNHPSPGPYLAEREEEEQKEDSIHVNEIGCTCTGSAEPEIRTFSTKVVAENFDTGESSATTSTTLPEVYFDALGNWETKSPQCDAEDTSKRERDDRVMQAASEMVLEVLKLVDVFIDRLGMEEKAWS
ncbi:hypothetical protein DL95DRAFT_404254 [Leptodontidium sp. 2 PMI_412]|nr:hypothetical protein DL95DRAFT_404254 [Leptodontidium sp. 2 PMI_412]